MNTAFASLVVVAVEDQRFAVPVELIERVVRAVKVAPLPRAPRGVVGVINLRGSIVPVFEVRQRLGLASRPLQVTDHLVIARTSRQRLALVVDAVLGVVEGSEVEVTPSGEILPGLSSIAGVMKLHGEVVLVEDLEKFLSADEHLTLERALVSE